MTRIERQTVHNKSIGCRSLALLIEGLAALIEPDKESNDHATWDEMMTKINILISNLNELVGMSR